MPPHLSYSSPARISHYIRIRYYASLFPWSRETGTDFHTLWLFLTCTHSAENPNRICAWTTLCLLEKAASTFLDLAERGHIQTAVCEEALSYPSNEYVPAGRTMQKAPLTKESLLSKGSCLWIRNCRTVCFVVLNYCDMMDQKIQY